MKTKFILHGGGLSHGSKENETFFQEFTKDLEDGDLVLHIGFARLETEKRVEIFERDKNLILAQTNKEIIVESAEHETLLEQVKNASAVFVTGGKTRALMHDLLTYGPELRELLAGKVYAGTSAGAQVLATYFHLCQENRITEGMEWLPIRLMVHYGNEAFNGTEDALEKLTSYGPGSDKKLEVVTLRECEWIVREVDLED